MKRSYIKRSTKPLKRTPMKKVSTRQAKRLRTYRQLRRLYLDQHPFCEVCKTAHATDIHHKGDGEGPKRGSNTNKVEHWMAVCRPCHDRIENNKSWARSQGYLT